MHSKKNLLESLQNTEKESDLSSLKKEIEKISKVHPFDATGKHILQQIINSLSIGRAKHYLKRLLDSLIKVKTSAYNDINLNCWKNYDDVLTDSLWVMDKRDRSGDHHAGYWGNFIPQIPHQLLQRYTQKGDWVLDPFCGSGTTLIEAAKLKRNAFGIELNPTQVEKVKNDIQSDLIFQGNSQHIDYVPILQQLNINALDFILFHPPYWDIIQFSEDPNDLSQAKSMETFNEQLKAVCQNAIQYLRKKRFCALVISDMYQGSEWLPLGFYAMQAFQSCGLKLKSIVVKNFNQTKAKRQQEELWRYRALVGGYYVFKHEYIFVFQN